MRRAVLVLALVACHGRPPTVAVTVVTSGAHVETTAPPAQPKPTAPMTPGSVAIGLIEGPPLFDPMPALEAAKPAFLKCFADARLITPDLHGKLTLEVHVGGAGAVGEVSAQPGGKANDPGLVGCLGDVLKGVTFPKPAGLATLTIPMVFRQ